MHRLKYVNAVITSLRNPEIKHLRSLRLRKHREGAGHYLVEGIRAVGEAIDRGAPVEMLVHAPDLLVSERARALLESVAPQQRLAVSSDVFRSLSNREDPQGIAALVRIEEHSLADIHPSLDLLSIVAHQIRDPGNLGAMIRTADAVGATGVVVTGPSVDLYDPETVRASMGSLFALPIICLPDDAALPAWYADLRSEGLPLLVVASSARGSVLHYDVDYRRPVILLVGNERYGLPESVRDTADVVVRLPMAGRATSLNVSAAMAALVYEIVRQRRG